ncbi:MAG: DsrE family protein [Chromatiales bacterium]|nr:DsrE family protein [Chromatiales bacterium]
MHKSKSRVFVMSFLLLSFCLVLAQSAFAAMNDDVKHKVVIQVSSDDPRTQNIALNNAVNLQKALGQDNVAVEIVAYGPGLSLLTKTSERKDRVASLAMQDITFSACSNTMHKMERMKGKKPMLTEGVQVVPAGVLRIMELQQQGYAYIRP